MADNSRIEWTDATWNPVTGCTKVSAGCDHCYAERVTERFHGKGSFATVQLHLERLDQPLRWTRPRRVFVNSMSDLFHDDVPDGFIAWVFYVMSQCPQHTFQILTKRHARMRSFMRRWADQTGDDAHDKPSGMPPMPRGPEAIRATYTSGRAMLFADMLDQWGQPPEGAAYPLYDWMEGPRFWETVPFNVWLGVSVENQQWADIRIPALLDTPAAVRFLSCEPLLGPVDLSRIPNGIRLDGGPRRDSALTEACPDCGGWGGAPCNADGYHFVKRHGGIDWVIVGGESGPHARPMHPQWATDIRDLCVAAGVPFFFKQWGEWVTEDQSPEDIVLPATSWNHLGDAEPRVWKVGKKAAGRELDGRTWDQYPAGPP